MQEKTRKDVGITEENNAEFDNIIRLKAKKDINPRKEIFVTYYVEDEDYKDSGHI